MKLSATLLIIATSLILGSHGSAHAQALSMSQQKLEGRIDANRIRLEERQSDPGKAIPPQVLNAAKGIIIINRVKVGAIIGAELGNGIAMVKNADGRWGAPAFLSLGKGSFGLQAGADTSITFLILMNDESLKLLRGGHAATAGISLKATGGPKSVGGDIGTISLQKPIFVYSSSVGAFSGAAAEVGAFAGASKKNHDMYGMTMDQILFGGTAMISPKAQELINAISKYSQVANY